MTVSPTASPASLAEVMLKSPEPLSPGGSDEEEEEEEEEEGKGQSGGPAKIGHPCEPEIPAIKLQFCRSNCPFLCSLFVPPLPSVSSPSALTKQPKPPICSTFQCLNRPGQHGDCSSGLTVHRVTLASAVLIPATMIIHLLLRGLRSRRRLPPRLMVRMQADRIYGVLTVPPERVCYRW